MFTAKLRLTSIPSDSLSKDSTFDPPPPWDINIPLEVRSILNPTVLSLNLSLGIKSLSYRLSISPIDVATGFFSPLNLPHNPSPHSIIPLDRKGWNDGVPNLVHSPSLDHPAIDSSHWMVNQRSGNAIISNRHVLPRNATKKIHGVHFILSWPCSIRGVHPPPRCSNLMAIGDSALSSRLNVH